LVFGIWVNSQFMDFFPFLHDSFSQGRSAP
jgi:hypothetical protein